MEILYVYNMEFLFTDFHGRYERVALQWRGGAVLGCACRSISGQNPFRSE
jgi:hypothetical protein